MLEESENGGFTLKTHPMFQNAAITILNLYLRKTRSVKSHNYCDAIVFQKRFVFEMFSTLIKDEVFKFLGHRFEGRFRKARFS